MLVVEAHTVFFSPPVDNIGQSTDLLDVKLKTNTDWSEQSHCYIRIHRPSYGPP